MADRIDRVIGELLVRRCALCGQELPKRKTGRPATYCSTDCRRLEYDIRSLAQRVSRVHFRTPEARKAVISELWRAAAVGSNEVRGQS